ncbi:transposase [Egibacter rhizosphaerae]|uniref:transposase n=1 Tax=Egibacter rhizosphaerae TaxID=1670831 RepID=UPI0013F173A0|nr:transposase [Egibacter rhizosphaerae]
MAQTLEPVRAPGTAHLFVPGPATQAAICPAAVVLATDKTPSGASEPWHTADCIHGSDGQQHGAQRTRRKFSAEFKREAVELVRTSGKSIADVAAELGISDTSLGNWVRQARVDDGERDGVSSDERERLRTLEQENAHLRMERDLLKRTVAFWVKEST